MAYENPYLEKFTSLFFAVLKEKEINPAKIELIIFDEDLEERNAFERVRILDVLFQLYKKLNALKIYTDRPEFFCDFIEQSWEEAGLLVVIMPKREQNKVGVLQFGCARGIILDFERKGLCYGRGRHSKVDYIPIYKKPWEMDENLDIRVPFGYNVVIVKEEDMNDKRFIRDRFEEGFFGTNNFTKRGNIT